MPEIGQEYGTPGDIPTRAVGTRWIASSTSEHVEELRGLKALEKYDEMRRTDYQIGAVLKAITLPIRRGNWTIDPASNETQDRDIAERLQLAYFDEMTVTWDDVVRWVLLMLPFGFSALEQVLEYRDGLVLPRKLDIRHPRSIVGEVRSRDGTLTHLVQRVDHDEVDIPVDQLLIFSTDREGDDWRGTSILRTAYKPYLIKDDLERINALGHARWSAGIPILKVPHNYDPDSKEWEDAESMMDDVRSHEKAYIIYPEGWEPSVLGRNEGVGGAGNPLPSIQHYDQAIASALLAMHITLGGTRTGSRALGGTFIDSFLHAIEAWADYGCQVISRFSVRPIVDRNWGPQERYPRVRVRNIHRIALEIIGYLAQTGAIKLSEALDRYLKETLDVPPAVTEGEEAEPEEDEDGGDDGEVDPVDEDEEE